jgi:hypothetical protein
VVAALLAAHHIFHISRIKVKERCTERELEFVVAYLGYYRGIYMEVLRKSTGNLKSG